MRTPFVIRFLSAMPRAGWIALGIFAALTLLVMPALHLFVAPESPFHVSNYVITLGGKIICYAIVAVAMDLIWGYAGILSLGHGVFFALGGYAFGMYLMREIGTDGSYHSHLPDFMVFLDWKELPWYWTGSDSFLWALLLVLLVPALVAYVFGYFAFRSRIKGVYFSIITQALTFAAMLFFFRDETGFGGNNGFTDFKRILGFTITAPQTKAVLYLVTLAMLLGALVLARSITQSKLGRVLTGIRDAESRLMFVGYDITSPEMRVTLFGLSALVLMLTLLGGRYLVTSKFGRVLAAIRDAESRVMFIGYNPLHYKLFVWTLSAMLCAVAGALYVPQVGIINPGEMSPANSIEIAIWVAVGGRGTLIGPVIGAALVNLFKSYFTVAFPEYWLFFLGALFVGVTLWLPEGVVGLWKRIKARSAA